jgi:hypothetical protein
VARVLPLLGGLLVHHAEYERAETLLLEAHAILEPQVPNQAQARARVMLCELYLTWGPPHGEMLARRYAAAALELARGRGEDDLLLEALDATINVELRGARPQDAAPLVEEFEALARASNPTRWAARALFARARLCLASGRPDEARAHLERAVALAEAAGYPRHAQAFGIELDCLDGDVARARSRLAWLEARGQRALAEQVRRRFPDLERAGPADAAPPPDAPGVRLRVLGPVALERGGEAVPTRARKRLELLACLLETRIAGRGEASALDLAEALYPDAPEAEARNTLKQQVYLIRSALGPNSVLSGASGYALGAVSSDAEDFLASGDAALWRGVYLEGLGEGWLPGVRDALALALRARVEALLTRGDRSVARLARVLCAMDPYDQEALRLAVLALRADGQGSAAHALYAERRSVLLEVGEHLPAAPDQFLVGARP